MQCALAELKTRREKRKTNKNLTQKTPNIKTTAVKNYKAQKVKTRAAFNHPHNIRACVRYQGTCCAETINTATCLGKNPFWLGLKRRFRTRNGLGIESRRPTSKEAKRF